MYGVTEVKESFSNLSYWMEIIENNRKKGCHLMLVGNKLDIKDQRQVERNLGQSMAEDIQNDIKVKFEEEVHGRSLMVVIFGETSALTGENVKTWFGLMEDNIIKEFKDQTSQVGAPPDPGAPIDTVATNPDPKGRKGCKC